MQTTFRSQRTTKVALYLLLAVTGLGSAGHALAQSTKFDSEADTISGTVTNTSMLTGLTQTTTIAPVDQSTTDVSGSNQQSAASASQTIYGVNVYSFDNIVNSTSDSYDSSSDEGDATASAGAGSLLGGAITWNGESLADNCKPDANVSGQIDCSEQGTISGLVIDGKAIPTGNYPAGTEFPVKTTIADSNCPLGTETFEGKLVLEPSTLSGYGTQQGSYESFAFEVTGTATCGLLGAVPTFQDVYDLKIAGPLFDFDFEDIYSFKEVEIFKEMILD